MAAPLLVLFDPALVPVPLILLTTVHSVLAVAAASAVLLIGRAVLL